MSATREPVNGWRLAAAGALLAAVVTAAYLPLRHNDFVNFDDDWLILNNPALSDLSAQSLRQIFERQLWSPHYKPLVYLSWAAELRLFGPDPGVFHRHNLLLHLLNTMLVLTLAARLTPARTETRWRLAGAVAVAAIWALHPMKVESVAWASERKDVLFAAFYLGALLAYLRYLEGRRRGWLAASALLLLAATLSKSAAITLLPALLLVDLARGRRWERALALEKLPHLAVTLLALCLYGLLPGPGQAGGALPLLVGAGPAARLAAAGHRHLAFVAHWLAPLDLAVLYPVPDFLARPHWARLAGLALGHLALLAGLIAGCRRRPLIAAAALFFTVTLLPTLAAPVSPTNYLSDRYTYLPSLGLAALAVLAAGSLAGRRPALRPVLVGAAAVLAALLGLMTHRQLGVWRDSLGLWNHVLETHGPHPYAYNNRGVARLHRGEVGAALADFDRALALRPAYPEALANRGNLRRRQGRLEEGLADLDRAVALAPDQGRLYRLRGLARVALGRLATGIADYDRALELDPEDAETLYLRAQARRRAGDLAGARADADRALTIGARTSANFQLRSLLRAQQGDLPGALADADRAVQLDPSSAVDLNNRGFLRLELGDPAGALADLERALSRRPGYALAHRNRGDALAALGRTAEACAAWRAAAAGAAPDSRSRLAACPPADAGGTPPAAADPSPSSRQAPAAPP